MSEPTLAKIIDKFIGECRSAPLIPDFREVVSKSREVLVDKQREQYRKDAKDFWGGTFHDDEVKQIVSTIKRRLLGECPDDEWNAHMETLRSAEKLSASSLR